MSTPLVYSPLRDDALNFRLVKLHPATDSSDTLRIDVEEYPRTSAPPYEALSYAWGVNEAGGFVSISNRNVAVSETVETALRHLRLASAPRQLWINQLCINQTDDREKSHQVGQMHRIYAEAERAVVWLGPGGDEMEYLFSVIRETADLIVREDLETLEETYRPSYDDEEGHDEIASIREAFEEFSAKYYWTRLWIYQEFVVARRVSIVCGEHSIDANEFGNLFPVEFPSERVLFRKIASGLEGDVPADDAEQHRLKTNAALAASEASMSLRGCIDKTFNTPTSDYVAYLMIERSIWERRRHEVPLGAVDANVLVPFKRCLFDVMTMAQVPLESRNFRGASDERDRVFAMLNLASDKDRFPEFPDYNMTAARTYAATAQRFLELGHHQMLAYNQFPKRMASLPSWVPDWSGSITQPMSNYVPNFRMGLADDSVLRVSFPRDRVLEIEGALYDVIEKVGPDWQPDWMADDIDHAAVAAFLGWLVELFSREQQRDPVQATLRAASLTLAVITWDREDDHDDRLIEWADHIRNIAAEGRAGDMTKTLDETVNGSCGHWMCEYLRTNTARRPFLTANGHVGFSVPQVHVGDELCGFSGTNIPHVLLRGAGNGKYVFVGDAYVEKGVKGELVEEAGDEARRSFLLV